MFNKLTITIRPLYSAASWTAEQPSEKSVKIPRYLYSPYFETIVKMIELDT